MIIFANAKIKKSYPIASFPAYPMNTSSFTRSGTALSSPKTRR